MPKFQIKTDERFTHSGESAIRQSAFDKFNPSVLGLGTLSNESTTTPAICALFDLEGFTNFCKQVEPHLSVPIYLNGFLGWIFGEIRKETIEEQTEEGVAVWHDLPFFVKFMGDGLMVMWDTTQMSINAQHNLILSCRNITQTYVNEFLKDMRRKTSDTPPILRCGIAKGNVFSVGNGEDYVGSCINIAARLQKLNGINFAFTRRGFDPEEAWKDRMDNWLLKKVQVRGIGNAELIYIRKEDFTKMPPLDQKIYIDP